MNEVSNQFNQLTQFSAAVLAGGRGQRMGGRDKGWIEWRSRPMIEHIHAVLRPLTDDLIISCNRNIERYAQLADQVVSDESQDFSGPLAGILAALRVARHPYLLVLPCDAPKIDQKLILDLWSTAESVMHSSGGVSTPVMLRQGRHWQPLMSVIPTSLLPNLETAWNSGQRSPRAALLELGAHPLECSLQDERLTNMNTPEVVLC